jgi:hypothetical protein
MTTAMKVSLAAHRWEGPGSC